MKDIAIEAVKKFGNIDPEKVLKILEEFSFNHSADLFKQACFESIVEKFKDKVELTDEEFLALLVRLCMMNFVEVKCCENFWFLLLIELLPEELKQAKKSEAVEKFEKQFIESMEIIKEMYGIDVMRASILCFLFDENIEFVAEWFKAFDIVLEKIKKMMN